MSSILNPRVPNTNPTTGITVNPVIANKQGAHLKSNATGILQERIQPQVLDQHATALRGNDIPLSSAILTQGAPVRTGALPTTGYVSTGLPLTTGLRTTGLPTTGLQATGVPLTGLTTTGLPNTGAPVTNMPPQTGAGIPVGVTNHAGLPVGVTGYNQPSTGATGLAGVSQASAQGIQQGNINKGAIANTEGLIQTNVLPTHNVPGNTTAQGQFTFRPIEGRFINNDNATGFTGLAEPYVKIKVGWHILRSLAAQNQGNVSAWTDVITLPRKHNETFAKVVVKDKRPLINYRLGSVKINLDEVVQRGQVQNWYPITTPTGERRGEILMAVEYAPLFIK